MSTLNKYFCETHIIGEDCRQNELDQQYFPILKEAPFIWVGYSVLNAPFRMVRLNSVHSHVVACVEGKGRTLIDNNLIDFGPDQVMLGPVGAHHCFEAISEEPWKIAWVFYHDSIKHPLLRGSKAQLIKAETEPFATCLKMLLRESAGAAQPAAMSCLVNLLDIHTRRMTGIDKIDDRLWKLWIHADAHLAHSWNVRKLARIACVSEEHLRRLCHQYYQRSPMDHLTHLRMRRASTLLRTTSHTVDIVAQSVGYASMYSFSVAFKRWCGQPPSEYRRKNH